MNNLVHRSRALEHLMDLLRIEGLSGDEGRVAAAITKKLREAGCKASWISRDQVHKRIPGDFKVGNLIVKLPGTVKGPRRLLMGHMDTVPLCRGAVPVQRGDRIVSKGPTGLGADNRTACACLVTMVESLLENELPHPPLTVLFTVGEEVGLWGARFVHKSDLGNPRLGFNIDSGAPAELIVGAIGADRWTAEITGRSAHAGVHPEHGISATLIAARAIEQVAARGFFGKVVKGKQRGTSNVGRIEGGEASNQVTDRVVVKGESRSHDPAFVAKITSTYRTAFERAARSVKDHRGRTGKVTFRAKHDYDAFRIGKDEPVVAAAREAARKLGLKPKQVSVDGGLDANYLNARGIPTVTIGAGQHSPHTVDEYVDIAEYLDGCRLALALALGP